MNATADGKARTPRPPIGYSSGTLPSASADELAAAVLAAGGTGLDLRIGKGHAWERDGLAAGLDRIAAAGVDVFFTGVGWRLGDPAGWPLVESDQDSVPREYPVKVFCVADPDLALVADQLAAASAAGLEPWVETHAGGPDAGGLLRLAEKTGVGVLLDLLGLAEIGGASPGQLRALAPFLRAAQVKGVLRTTQGTRHRPLAYEDLTVLLELMQTAALRAVTVESRAGTPEADLAVLARAVAHQLASPTPTPSGQETPR